MAPLFCFAFGTTCPEKRCPKFFLTGSLPAIFLPAFCEFFALASALRVGHTLQKVRTCYGIGIESRSSAVNQRRSFLRLIG